MTALGYTIVTITFLLCGVGLTVFGHQTEGMLCLTAAAGSFALETRMRAKATERRAKKAEKTAIEALEATQTIRREDLPPRS